MTIETRIIPPAPPMPASRNAGDPLRTNNQMKASAVADGIAVKAKWKALVGEAKTTWTRVAPEELAKVNGNFHRLAGLVQMHHQLSREESDRQVKAFFDKHYAPTPAPVPVAAPQAPSAT